MSKKVKKIIDFIRNMCKAAFLLSKTPFRRKKRGKIFLKNFANIRLQIKTYVL